MTVSPSVVKMLRMDESAAIQDQWMAETEGKGTLIVWLAKLLQKNLDVKPSRESNVINIQFSGADPTFAASVANSFAQPILTSILTEGRLQRARTQPGSSNRPRLPEIGWKPRSQRCPPFNRKQALSRPMSVSAMKAPSSTISPHN